MYVCEQKWLCKFPEDRFIIIGSEKPSATVKYFLVKFSVILEEERPVI